MAGRVLYNTIFLGPQIFSIWKLDHSTQYSHQVLADIEEILSNFLNKPFSTEDREIFTVKVEQFQQQLKDPGRFDNKSYNSMDQQMI